MAAKGRRAGLRPGAVYPGLLSPGTATVWRPIRPERRRFFRQAAEDDYPPAVCELGLCYEMGAGLEEDKAQAVRWYTRAAELGYAPGQCNLGCCYLTGIGVEEDDVQAVRWLTGRGAGLSRAQRLLGCCCRDRGWHAGGCAKSGGVVPEGGRTGLSPRPV